MTRANLVIKLLRLLTWCCVVLLAVLSLLPAQAITRTGLPGQFEHFIAYAGSAAIAMAGYGLSRGGMRIIGGFWAYAGVLEYLQHFSPGRHPSLEDFAASALGALCGGLAITLLWNAPPEERDKTEPFRRSTQKTKCRPLTRNRKFVDSLLEGNGFERSVPH